jgi:hypothetical protein
MLNSSLLKWLVMNARMFRPALPGTLVRRRIMTGFMANDGRGSVMSPVKQNDLKVHDIGAGGTGDKEISQMLKKPV